MNSLKPCLVRRTERSASCAGNAVMEKARKQRVASGNELVWLNVGGQDFLVHRSTLFRVPHSRLYRVASNDFSVATGIISNDHRLSIDNNMLSLMAGNFSAQQSQPSDASFDSVYPATQRSGPDEPLKVYNAPHLRKPRVCIYFDRDPEIFRYILDYYRNGELHIPHSLCGPNIRKELIFWGVPETDIQVCCLKNYMRYDEENTMKALLFKDFVEDLAPMKNLVRISRGWRQKRYRIWLFLDYPTSSLPAKCWAFVQLIFVILSILFYCVRTHPMFRTARRYFHSDTFIGGTVQANASLDDEIYCESLSNMSYSQKYISMCTEPQGWLRMCDMLLMVHFAADGLCKLLVAPDRMRYCKRVLVLLEVVIQTSFWTMISVRLDLHTDDAHYFWPLNIINVLQALRIARILKVAKLSDGLRVLILTLKRSITELVLLAFLMVNGMFLFACMIYMAEYEITDNFPTIPTAFWWSIITLTGVGYGDVTPKSPLGYFVGGLTAVCGAMVTGLAIPIIGHNFNSYYKYMKSQLKETEYLKQKADKPEQQDLEIFDKLKLKRVRSISLLPVPSIRVDSDDLSADRSVATETTVVLSPAASPPPASAKALKAGLNRLKKDTSSILEVPGESPFKSDNNAYLTSSFSLQDGRRKSACCLDDHPQQDDYNPVRSSFRVPRSRCLSICSPSALLTTPLISEACQSNGRQSDGKGSLDSDSRSETDEPEKLPTPRNCASSSPDATVTRTERLVILKPDLRSVALNDSSVYRLESSSDSPFSSAAVITTPITRID